jgi:hypothetical protein
MKTQKTKPITADEFDAKADRGEDMSEHVDWSRAVKMINLSLPVWMVKALDKEAKRIGIDRQAVVKTWIVERLDHMTQNDKVKKASGE